MPQPQTNEQPVGKRVKNFDEVSLGYQKRVMLQEAIRCPQCTDAVCRPACPLGIDIPAFIRLLREGDVVGALAKIREHNDLPGICGRLCLAPCETACILEKEKSPIGIRALERYAHDHGRPRFAAKRPAIPRGKKIAVVGSGPAGLTSAAQLAKSGFRVTIFEALPEPGGMLRYGVPEFRLPRHVLDAQIDDTRLLGVEIKTGSPVGRSLSLDELSGQGYTAVLLTIGKSGPVSFDTIPGTQGRGVYYGKEILWEMNSGARSHCKDRLTAKIGRRVVVIGSGADALDCARICVRLGRVATLIFPEIYEDLRIYPADREAAKAEGVNFEALTQPLEMLLNADQGVTGVRCVRLDFADADGSGKWRLLPVPDSEFMVEADTVMMAPAFKTNAAAFGLPADLKINDDGSLWTDPATGMTSRHGVFAAGDAVDGCHTLVDAMASAKQAAVMVRQFLQREA